MLDVKVYNNGFNKVCDSTWFGNTVTVIDE